MATCESVEVRTEPGLSPAAEALRARLEREVNQGIELFKRATDHRPWEIRLPESAEPPPELEQRIALFGARAAAVGNALVTTDGAMLALSALLDNPHCGGQDVLEAAAPAACGRFDAARELVKLFECRKGLLDDVITYLKSRLAELETGEAEARELARRQLASQIDDIMRRDGNPDRRTFAPLDVGKDHDVKAAVAEVTLIRTALDQMAALRRRADDDTEAARQRLALTMRPLLGN